MFRRPIRLPGDALKSGAPCASLKNAVFAALAICTLLCNLPSISRSFQAAFECLRSRQKAKAEYMDGPRALVAEHLAASDSLCFLSSGDLRERSAERAALQAVNWQLMPQAIDMVSTADFENATSPKSLYSAILSPAFDEGASASLSAEGSPFVKIAERGGRFLWLKKGRPPITGRDTAVSPAIEALGLMPIAAVLVAGGMLGGIAGSLSALVAYSVMTMLGILLGMPPSPFFSVAAAVFSCMAPWLLRNDKSRKPGYIATMPFALAVLAVSALTALAHDFTTPYGLAVTGGRAKLWYLLSSRPGGFPGSGFFTNPAWRILEPAYPPGCTAIVMGCYETARACGEWLTQLLGCILMSMLAYPLIGHCDNIGKRLWGLSLFLVPAAMTIGGQFYPEPFMALCVIVGWDRIRKGDAGFFSWFIVGSAGWFKNEGLILAIAAWIAWRIVGGARSARIWPFLIALALPLLWHAGCRIGGGALNDYAPIWKPSPERGTRAFCEIIRQAAARPWQHAFAYPAAAVLAVYGKLHRGHVPAPLAAACIFAVLSLLSFAITYAFSTAPDFSWHIGTSLSRLLWTPALVLAYETASD